jgi:hypothetical protein
VAPWNSRKEHGTCSRVQSCRAWPTKAILIWREGGFTEAEGSGRRTRTRYTVQQAREGSGSWRRVQIRQVWGMTLAGSGLSTEAEDKGHCTCVGTIHSALEPQTARTRPERQVTSALHCSGTGASAAEGHASLSGLPTLLTMLSEHATRHPGQVRSTRARPR